MDDSDQHGPVVAIGMAVLATVMLRDVPRTADAEPAQPAGSRPLPSSRDGSPSPRSPSSGQLPRLRRPGAA